MSTRGPKWAGNTNCPLFCEPDLWCHNFNMRTKSTPRRRIARARRGLTKRTRSKVSRRRATKVTPSVRKFVRHEINKDTEVKFTNTTVVDNTLSNETAMETLDNYSNVAQGLQVNNRIGDELKAIGLQTKMSFRNATANVLYIRVCFFWTWGEFGTTLVTGATELFTDYDNLSTSFATITGTPGVINYPLNKKAVIPLIDKIFKLAKNTETNGADNTRLLRFKRLNTKIRYSDATQGTTNQSKQLVRIIMCYAPNNATASASLQYQYNEQTKFYYTDK